MLYIQFYNPHKQRLFNDIYLLPFKVHEHHKTGAREVLGVQGLEVLLENNIFLPG